MIDGINTFTVDEKVVVVNGKAEVIIRDEHKVPLCNVILNDVSVQNDETIEPSIRAIKDTELSVEHKLLMRLVLEDAEDDYTEKQLMYLIEVHSKKDQKIAFDKMFWQLTISELVLLNCFVLEGKVYTVNVEKMNKYLGIKDD